VLNVGEDGVVAGLVDVECFCGRGGHG
jgi:hypothetical protein